MLDKAILQDLSMIKCTIKSNISMENYILMNHFDLLEEWKVDVTIPDVLIDMIHDIQSQVFPVAENLV